MPADTNSRLATTGVEIEFFFSSSDGSSLACPLDTRRADGSNGITIVCNYSSSVGGSNPNWLSIVATDNAAPPRTSYLDFFDGVAPFWRDGLKHKLAVRYRKSESPATANEVFEAELDGVVLTPIAALRNQAGSTGGTFTDHSEFIRIGSGTGGVRPWTAVVQQFAWFDRVRTAAESKAVWGAACYDIGDGIGCGLNGVVHYDVSGPVYATPGLSGLASTGTQAASIPNRYDVARGGDGSWGGASNSTGGLTRPTLVQDARGYRALYFDNLNQNTTTQKQSLAIGSLSPGGFGLAQTSMTAVVAARAGSTFAVGTGNIMRLLGTSNQLRLTISSDRPAVQLNTVNVGTLAGSIPLVPCVPGPGVVGVSTRTVGGVPRGWVACNGAVGALSRDLALGAYWSPLNSGGTLGCCDGEYNGFDGLFYESLIESCAHDEADQAVRNAWLAHKWGMDGQDLRLIIGCTSIEIGTPAGAEYAASPATSLGWAGFLSPFLQKRFSCFNAAIGGSQSGRLFTTDGSNTPYVDNGNYPATERGYGSPTMYQSGGATVPGGTIVILEPFTNSVAKSVVQHGGEDVSAQCISHIETLLGQIHSAAPAAPVILLMYPSNSSFAFSSSSTGVALTAWAAAHSADFAAVITPNALPSGQWIHPTGGLPGSNSNDYLYLAGLIEPVLLSLVPPRAGVCCAPTGACWTASASGPADDACIGTGTFTAGATCLPTPCEGACCSSVGSCILTVQSECAGGSVWTSGTTCTGVPCAPQPVGACCDTATVVCTIVTSENCQSSPWVSGATCAATPCEAGACCSGSSCSIKTADTCPSGSTFHGLGTTCGSAGNPVTCCAANFNRSNGLTVQDVFDFLSAWFDGDLQADTNGDGRLSVGDVFLFLSLWFAGCA